MKCIVSYSLKRIIWNQLENRSDQSKVWSVSGVVSSRCSQCERWPVSICLTLVLVCQSVNFEPVFCPGGVPVRAQRELPLARSAAPQSQHGPKLCSLQIAGLWTPCWRLRQVEYTLLTHTRRTWPPVEVKPFFCPSVCRFLPLKCCTTLLLNWYH